MQCILKSSWVPFQVWGSFSADQGCMAYARMLISLGSLPHRRAAQLINAALDISALFDARTDVVARMTRFTSRAAPGALLSRVEEAAHALGGRTRRRDDARCSPATANRCSCLPTDHQDIV